MIDDKTFDALLQTIRDDKIGDLIPVDVCVEGRWQNVDLRVALTRIAAERDAERINNVAEIKRLRGALYTVMGACDAECSACGAYYVAKRALDGMETP